MIQAIVLGAEVLCALWFVLFFMMLTSMHREAGHMAPPFMDRFGRTLVTSARIAFALGMLVLFGLSGWQVIEFIRVA